MYSRVCKIAKVTPSGSLSGFSNTRVTLEIDIVIKMKLSNHFEFDIFLHKFLNAPSSVNRKRDLFVSFGFFTAISMAPSTSPIVSTGGIDSGNLDYFLQQKFLIMLHIVFLSLLSSTFSSLVSRVIFYSASYSNMAKNRLKRII